MLAGIAHSACGVVYMSGRSPPGVLYLVQPRKRSSAGDPLEPGRWRIPKRVTERTREGPGAWRRAQKEANHVAQTQGRDWVELPASFALSLAFC